MLNRARADPVAEVVRIGPGGGWEGTPGINEGVPANQWGPEARQPLAWNPNLGDAARKHSKFMSDNNVFEHNVTINGVQVGPSTRGATAGYTGSTIGVGENLARTIARAEVETVETLHKLLFVDAGVAGRGHRALILNGGANEIGIGLFNGPFDGSPFTLATENLGNKGAGSFLLGAAFRDLNSDQFYQPGEQLGGVTITATRTGDHQVFTTTTWAAGGYALKLDPGSYVVTATGGEVGTPAPRTVTIGTQNVASDFIAASATPAAPTIVTQPKDLTPFLSQTTASFAVTATGNPTPSVQWQSAPALSDTFADVAGATGFTYTFAHQPTQNGTRFRAVLTNGAGSVTSSPATLTVQNGTPIPIAITATPKSQTVNAGDTVTFTAAATGFTRLQWSLSTDGGKTSNPIAGATGLTYSFVAKAADSGNRYSIEIGNSSGSREPQPAVLTVNANNAPPAVVVPPQPTPVTAGQSAPVTVVPAGFPDPNVQWEEFGDDPEALERAALPRADGATSAWRPVAGGTGATLNVTGGAAGSKRLFRAVLTNGEGSVTTAPVAVTTNAKTPLANDVASLKTASAAALDSVETCRRATQAVGKRLTADLKRLKASKENRAILAKLVADEKAARTTFTKNLAGVLKAMAKAASAALKDFAKLQKRPSDAALAAKLQADVQALRTAADAQTVAADATACKLATVDQLAPLAAVAPEDAGYQEDLEAARATAFSVGQSLQAPMTIALAVVERIESRTQA